MTAGESTAQTWTCETHLHAGGGAEIRTGVETAESIRAGIP
jgi:hypothetical protein